MEEILELTKSLIRFQTVQAKPEEIQRCAAFIENWLEDHGLFHERMDHGGVPSLWVAPKHRRVPVLLMSHLDVVDGPDESFEPYTADGRLFGRGSIDNKYAVALSLFLVYRHVEALKKEGLDQNHASLGILVTGDEETGGKNGAKKALEKIKADFCIALDGGNVGEIVVKEKGIFTLKLTSKGEAAHGSRPWLGKNAIDAFIEDYNRLKSFFPEPAGDHWHRTMSCNVLHAGKAFNQIPESAEAVFDIRYTENDDMDALYEEMRRSVHGDLRILKKEPLFFSGTSPYIDLLLEVSPQSRTTFEHGASDARFLSEFGVPGVVWGADGEQSAHSRKERVLISSIRELRDRLERFVKKVEAESRRRRPSSGNRINRSAP
ncbi:MAG: M20/M25/M40 family metallo-hydrolase [Deltaproteobacteria bacterium]|nr:M20/M25/M40 family metallo-hydrolase [Deltaproteobacteria bacterium]MBW2041655.1 M20/M25/M40 family metallo-hydrolase [Deltaproteobacteria bacterium]MBW2131113.1 M20/M25/M40 family metallo-hydrolase [Deltaproteobacteria bacterium]